MLEPLLDFQCYVGKYEIKRYDELDKKFREEPIEVANMPCLVQVGHAKLIRPAPKALNYAVGLLLQTKLSERLAKFIDGAPFIISDEENDDLDPEELSRVQRNVLAIARRIGMLTGGGPDPQIKFDFFYDESLRTWMELAERIQWIFTIRENEKEFDIPVGLISIFLSNRPQPISMHIRARNTHDALLYVAAGMVARGTVVQTCDQCGKAFLEGGERDRRNKKRAGSRFCSDKCRYDYHNEVRRKARATKS
jgi:hypothetical protein